MSRVFTQDDFDRVDRRYFQVFNSFEEAEAEDRRQWLACSPVQRMQALEHIRGLNYGYDPAEPQPEFQRVITITKHGGR